MFEKIKYRNEVNKALIELGIPLKTFSGAERSNLQQVGYTSDFSPQETAILGAGFLTLGMLDIGFEGHAEIVIKMWMVKLKVRMDVVKSFQERIEFRSSVVNQVIERMYQTSKDSISEFEDKWGVEASEEVSAVITPILEQALKDGTDPTQAMMDAVSQIPPPNRCPCDDPNYKGVCDCLNGEPL